MSSRRELVAALVLWALSGAGCVAHLPMAEQSPKLSYPPGASLVVSVVDERDWLARGKASTFLGRAHGSFGIPTDLHVYPYLSKERKDRKQSLAAAVEERIVFGLAGGDWNTVAAAFSARPTPEQIQESLRARNAQKMLVLTLREWFVSLNLNWVTAFNFDWAVDAEVFDVSGSPPVKLSAEGRDVVDVAYDQSYPNHIRLAYRDRLTKILEDPILRAALAPSVGMQAPDAPAE